MYRHNKQLLPASFAQYFNPIAHHYNTRLRVNEFLSLPPLRTDIGKQSLKFTGVKIWNQIPSDVREANSLDIFSDRVKAFIIEQRTT